MMLVFSTFMFGNPEFEKSYGESITSTLKFGMTKQEFAKIIQKKALSNSHDEGNYAVYYYANVKDPLGIERQLNSFNFVDGRLVSSVFDSQTTDAEHEQRGIVHRVLDEIPKETASRLAQPAADASAHNQLLIENGDVGAVKHYGT